jgi:hypothetical protein
MQLQVFRVADTSPPQFYLALDRLPSVLYTSVDSPTLRGLVRDVDDGTIIIWDGPASNFFHMYPNTKKQFGNLKSFAAYCKQQGVVFKIPVRL